MPDDASFSNIRIDVELGATDSTATVSTSYVSTINANTMGELRTALQPSGDTYPIGVLHPIGRGQYYNGLGVRFTENSNPLNVGIYIMDIYEKQSDGSEAIIESFEISFDPKATDDTGDSIWIQYVLAVYSNIMRFEMTEDGETEYSDGFKLGIKRYDKEIGTVSIDLTAISASISDTKQDFEEWESTSTPYTYLVEAMDARGNLVYGWIGDSAGTDGESADVYADRLLTVRGWNGSTTSFDDSDEITYEVKKSKISIATAFSSSTPVAMKKGSDGSLRNSDGTINTTTATQLLSQGYLGQLTSKEDGSTAVDDVLDLENIYYSVVFDCGYPTEVKTSISTLVQTRRDCVAILDNGDNANYTAALASRNDTHTFNNYFCALYESYNKVYDSFTGQDVWFSPVYHMSYLLPRNDSVAEIWFAVAGFNRAPIDTIRQLRFNPRLGQRDQFYLKQINPIVKFNPGYTVWGQLTTQAKPSALQDLNIVRLVLYCKRALEQFCRFFIFEQNDQLTWGQVGGEISLFLSDIQQRRGLYSYSVEVSATAYELKTKTFHVNVTLEPTRVVEKIKLNFFIK